MSRKIAIVIAGLVVILGAVVILISRITSDRIPPTIEFDDDELIEYHEGQDVSKLMYGMSAYDTKDGDVTKSLLVTSVIPLEEGEKARVWYVAKDRHNNVAKAYRIVKYHGESSTVQISAATEVTNATSAASANDEKETQSSASQNADKQPTTAMQTPTVEQTTVAPTELQPAGDRPVIKTSASEVTLRVGENFNVAMYVAAIADDKDDTETLYRRIICLGSYDVNRVGDYNLQLYCTDTDGYASERVPFVLHVR